MLVPTQRPTLTCGLEQLSAHSDKPLQLAGKPDEVSGWIQNLNNFGSISPIAYED